MSRYCSELTQEDVRSICNIVVDDKEPCGYKITYSAPDPGTGKGWHMKTAKPYMLEKYHKWSETTNRYWAVVVYKKCMTLARLLYAYFIDDVPAGLDIDHIDGNGLNNALNNLQLLDRKANLAKRKGYTSQQLTPKYLEAVNRYKAVYGKMPNTHQIREFIENEDANIRYNDSSNNSEEC